MNVLLTGFEPFGKLTANASWEAVKLVEERPGKNVTVHKLVLPVEYERAAELCIDAIKRLRVDAVLSVGVATRRRSLTPEYVAVNINDSTTPDNAGRTVICERIVDEGESALYTNIPYADMLNAILSAGVPAEASFDAGTFVCNDLFYRVMHDIRYNERKIYGGFLHVPPEQEVASREVARAIGAVLLMLADKGALSR